MISSFLKEYASLLHESTSFQFLKYYFFFFLGIMIDHIFLAKLNIYKLYEYYFIDKNFYVTNAKLVYYNLNDQLVTFSIFDYLKKKKM